MNLKELTMTSGFYNWTDVKERSMMGEIWTDRGSRIDGANRGDRHDYGRMMLRPEFISKKSKGKLLRKMTVIVNDADRDRVEYIIGNYGTYPENHEVIYPIGG